MPATPLTPVTLSRNTSGGVDVSGAGTAVDQPNGNSFPNDGKTIFRVNTTGTLVTPSVKYAVTVDGATVANKSLGATPATGNRLFGPFPPEIYGTTVEIAWSAAAGTVQVIQLA